MAIDPNRPFLTCDYCGEVFQIITDREYQQDAAEMYQTYNAHLVICIPPPLPDVGH